MYLLIYYFITSAKNEDYVSPLRTLIGRKGLTLAPAGVSGAARETDYHGETNTCRDLALLLLICKQHNRSPKHLADRRRQL